jgi:hypothetical protein
MNGADSAFVVIVGNINLGTTIGVLARENGGTGLSAAGADGNVLRSNGTDWVSAPITQAMVAKVPRVVADDAAASILNTTNALVLEGTTLAADKTIAVVSTYDGHELHIRLEAAVAGTYKLPVVGGDLTFTNANDSAFVVNMGAGVWRVLELGTCTIVP